MFAGLQTLIYPQLYRYILHPCVSWPGNPNMCGGLHTATGDLRFDSFLTQEDVVIMLIYEVRRAQLLALVVGLIYVSTHARNCEVYGCINTFSTAICLRETDEVQCLEQCI